MECEKEGSGERKEGERREEEEEEESRPSLARAASCLGRCCGNASLPEFGGSTRSPGRSTTMQDGPLEMLGIDMNCHWYHRIQNHHA